MSSVAYFISEYLPIIYPCNSAVGGVKFAVYLARPFVILKSCICPAKERYDPSVYAANKTYFV